MYFLKTPAGPQRLSQANGRQGCSLQFPKNTLEHSFDLCALFINNPQLTNIITL